MHSSSQRWCAPILVGALLGSLPVAGCQPVREDRSINWAADGGSVGFQHGPEGVFIAEPGSGKLTKVFQPDENVLASSPPLWSPSGRRALFTTARPLHGTVAPRRDILGLGDDPAGNIHERRYIDYTCWLYEQTPDGQQSKPVALFEAECDHVGYVAANLAVRWHPRGERVLFVKQEGAWHRLFEFDLATRQVRQIFPHEAGALAFDWTPDGSRLVCVVGQNAEGAGRDGIWVGQPDTDDWWHVPHSEKLTVTDLPSLIEQVRASRPAWTADSTRFAFTSSEPDPRPEQPTHHSLWLGALAPRETQLLAQGNEPYRDLHWRPDGKELGLVRGRGEPSLFFVRPGTDWPPPVNHRPMRRFAGWSASNSSWAYVAADFTPPPEKDTWAFLFVPDPRARDVVLVGGGKDPGPEREVFSGMRVTFPQWSPREDQLSLWVTFSPLYRSVASFFGWGLRAGDPAATFDLKTKQVRWLAVNPQEKVQVGHYYLLKRDYATAWRWYEEARRELPPPRPPTWDEFLGPFRQSRGPGDFLFFQYYCLTKLKRPDEARAKLDEFRRLFLPPGSAKPDPGAPAHEALRAELLEPLLRNLLDPRSPWPALLRDLYAAEVFLSLDAAADGEAFFRQELAEARADTERLGCTVALAQVLLLGKKHAAYAELATATLGPLLLRLTRTEPADKAPQRQDLQIMLDLLGSVSLAPLFVADFLAGLPDDRVRDMIRPWQTLRDQATREENRLDAERVLRALFRRLGMDKEFRESDQRLPGHTGGSQALFQEPDLKSLRQMLRDAMQVR